MFVTPAYAQTTGGTPEVLMSILPFILIFVIMYFLIIRPQRSQLKKRADMLAAVRRGDTVVTGGGLVGKVTKVNERQILVKLSDVVSGPVHLPDMADDFDTVNTLNHKKNDIVRVSIVEVDGSNKRLRLSLRPSRIMSSTLPVADKEVSSFSQIATGFTTSSL